MDNITGIVFIGFIKYAAVMTFALFAIFGGEPDLMDGIIHWISNGALK